MARAKYFSPLHLPLLPRRQITIMAAANHQQIRKPLRIPNHPFVGVKYFSPRHRPLVARNTLTISAIHHFWHGRKIFRPDVGYWCCVTVCPFLPRIIFGAGEIFFAPTLAIGTPHQTQFFKSLPTFMGWVLGMGTNRQAVTLHQWPMSGRKIFRPYKWMIGYAKRFANILMIGSGRGSDRVTEYQVRT